MPSAAAIDAPTSLAPSCAAMQVRRLSRKLTQIYDEALASHGLTIGQFGILAVLSRADGIGIAALATQLASDASTLSRLVRPLENAGLLRIVPDPSDGRAKLLYLSDGGAARVRAARAAWLAAQATVAERLGDGRLATLRFVLDDCYTLL